MRRILQCLGHPLERNSSPTSRFFWGLGVLTLFGVLTLGVTIDELRYPASLPLKSTDVATVPLFNVWTIGWNANRALHGFRGYWDAPIFHPVKNAFAFSEPQPATVLVAPIVWATGSAVAGYKAWLLLSLFLNGVFAALLLRRLGYGWVLQAAGGVAIVLLPVIHQRIDVLQLVPVWGILWFWSSLFELVKNPGPRFAVETGLSLGICFALSVHHAMFLSLLMAFAGLVFVPLLANRRFLAAIAAAIALGTLVALPIVLPLYRAANQNSFQRSDGLVKRMSLKPGHYLASPSNALIKFDRFQNPESRQFCPGWSRLALAVVGIGYGLFWSERRRWVGFLLLTGFFAFAFSLGLNLDLWGWRPWETVRESLPGFSQVRNVFRFVWFVQLAIVLLAVEGLAGLYALHQRGSASSWRTPRLAVLVLIPSLLAAVEVWPERGTRGGVPHVERNRGWIEFLRNRAAGGSVACLPFATGPSVGDYDMTTRWMSYGLEHGVPLVNGYSGFIPEGHMELQNRVSAEFPSTEVLELFCKFDVDYLVVARKYCEPDVLEGLATDVLRVDLVFADPAGIDVYRIGTPDGTAE